MNKHTGLESLIIGQSRAWHSAARFRWLVRGLLVVVLPLALFAMMDDVIILPTIWRWLAFGMVLIGLLWMAIGVRAVLRMPGRRATAAHLDEAATVKHGYVISTASEIVAPLPGNVERALWGRLQNEARRLAKAARPVLPQAGKCQIGLALGGMMLLGFAGPFAIKRMLRPWADLFYTSLTLTGPERLPTEREPFQITGKVSGRIPKAVHLQIGDDSAISLPVEKDGRYQYTFAKGISAPVVIVAHGNDGKSAPLSVGLRGFAHPVRFSHRITFPDYTRRAERMENQATFSILQGSEVHYSVTLSQEVRALRLIFDTNDTPVDLEAGSRDTLDWSVKLGKLARTKGYHLEALETDGVWRTCGEPAQIVVYPDQPPKVDIAKHNGEELKSPEDTFLADLTASDDIGLKEVTIRYQRIGDSAWKQKTIPFPEHDVTEHRDRFLLPLEELKVVPYDMVVVLIKARDWNGGEGNADPILFEVPGSSEGEKESGGGGNGGSGGGGNAEQVNPLEIQQQIYKDTLRLLMGRKDVAREELQRRQEENVRNISGLSEMVRGQVSPKCLKWLNLAESDGREAAMAMDIHSNYPSLERALDFESRVLTSLAEAAKLMDEQSGQSSICRGNEDQSGKIFTLKKPSSKSSESSEGESKNSGDENRDSEDKGNDSEDESREAVEKALADLDLLLQQQKDINQQLAKSQEGQPSEQQQEGGKQLAGNQQNQPLDRQQEQAAAKAEAMQRQLAAFQKPNDGGVAALAAGRLQAAWHQQMAAASAIINGQDIAGQHGEQAVREIEQARQLTRSLLGEASTDVAEMQTHAPDFNDLIQEYTRRLSYDE